MKFQTILYFVAAASLSFAQMSDVEDDNVASNSITYDTNDYSMNSEPEGNDISTDNNFGDFGITNEYDISPDNADINSNNIYPDNTNIYSNDIPSNNIYPDNTDIYSNDIPSNNIYPDSADIVPDFNIENINAGPNENIINGQDVGINSQDVDMNAGEVSDDYGNTDAIDAMDNNIEADAADAGEGSDDYGDNGVINANDISPNFNSVDAANATGENSDDDDDGSNKSAMIAAGIVGAAAISSAGIFLWAKKSKKVEFDSVRSQISMA